jgi:pyridoxal 5'-phosphate synthase pdxT subunit
MTITVGVLALQGAFLEHVVLLRQAYQYLRTQNEVEHFEFAEVRNVEELSRCDALIIPGGESTTISLVAAESNLLEPLRNFVK